MPPMSSHQPIWGEGSPRGFYCGIDLHAKVSQVAVMDEEAEVLLNHQTPNRIDGIHALLAPFGRGIHIAVESAFN